MKWSKRLSRYTLPGMGLKWDASYFGLLFLAMVLIVLYTFLRAVSYTHLTLPTNSLV